MDSTKKTLDVRRRDVLKILGLLASGCALDAHVEGGYADDALDLTSLAVINASLLAIRRPDDLVVLDVELVNMTRSGAQFVRTAGANAALIILRFAPQHVLERTHTSGQSVTPRVASVLSGPSRIVFRVPTGVNAIPATIDGILGAVTTASLAVSSRALPASGVAVPNTSIGTLGSRTLVAPEGVKLTPNAALVARAGASVSVDPHAVLLTSRRLRNAVSSGRTVTPAITQVTDLKAPASSTPSPPGAHETAIELPTRVQISPNAYTRFHHAKGPRGVGRRFELWHSELVALDRFGRPDRRASALRTVRALWTRDLQEGAPNAPLRPALFQSPYTPKQRVDLVQQTSNFQAGTPSAIEVDRLLLSALGAHYRARAKLTPMAGGNLVTYAQRTTLGRDHYVEFKERGFLYPWGHRATLATVTERQIRNGGSRVAALYTKHYLILDDLEQEYPDLTAGMPASLRRTVRTSPLRHVRMLERITPNLDGNAGAGPFVVRASGRTYRFPATVVDWDGEEHRTAVAAVFRTGDPTSLTAAELTALRNAYEGLDDAGAPLGTTRFSGARVAYAEGTDLDCAHPTESIVFGGNTESIGAAHSRPFLPTMRRAAVVVDAARTLTGNDAPLDLAYASVFTASGFGGSNQGALLFELAPAAAPLALEFSKQSDKTGGFFAPDMALTGISAKAGPVAGNLATVAAGQFNPAQFFGALRPKLFGVIDLLDLLNAGTLDNAPKIVGQIADEVESFLTDLSLVRSRLLQVQNQVQGVAVALTRLEAAVAAFGNLDFSADADPQIEALLANLSELRQALVAVVEAVRSAPPAALEAVLRRTTEQAIDKVVRVLEGGALQAFRNALLAFARAEELVKQRTLRLEFAQELRTNAWFRKLNDAAPNPRLVLAAEIRGQASGSRPAGADLICSLDKFALSIAGNRTVFLVKFQRMQFLTRAGSKPDIDVVLDDIEFHGPLRFIERIKNVIPLDGFSDPPAIDVGLDGLRARFSMPLPNLAVGVFSLENLSISAGFHIPFLGPPISISFGFCSRENPFLLTVTFLGGGGYLGLEIVPDGIRMLEAALEFGASLSMNLGVASGGVSIVAGIYFAVERTGESTECVLSGYLRIRGHVEVLRLIGASIELAMSLTYESASGKVIGRASMRIEVRLLCFSVGVTLSVERKFRGANSDPTFADVMSPFPAPALPIDGIDLPDTPWAQYVNAFAA
jgi:hypothetical protein